MDPEYKPDENDVLLVQSGSVGITCYDYPITNRNQSIRMIDIGNQYCDRRQWYHMLDNCQAILFIAALNHYSSIIGINDNLMHLTLEMYQNVLEMEWFKECVVIIFLNKEDLFDLCIYKGLSLKMCFDGVQGLWHGANEAIYNGPDFNVNYDYEADPDNLLRGLHDIGADSNNNVNIKDAVSLHMPQAHGLSKVKLITDIDIKILSIINWLNFSWS